MTLLRANLKQPYVSTTPPPNPYDGMLWVFPVNPSAGIRWTFQYVAASASPFKWEFIGGPYDAAPAVLAAEFRNIYNFWGDMQTVGPRYTLQRGGEYEVVLCGYAVGGVAATITARMSITVEGDPVNTTAMCPGVMSGAMDAGALVMPGVGSYITFAHQQLFTRRSDQVTAFVAGDVLRAVYAMGGNGPNIGQRYFLVRPRRVS